MQGRDPHFRWTGVVYGWISFVLDGGSGSYRCTVADTTDVPAELMAAVARVVRGSMEERVSFDHEPSETRWTLRNAGGAVDIVVESFESWGAAVGGDVQWQGRWPSADRFGRAFLDATESFLAEVGGAGYAAGWPAYPVPRAAVDDLRASVGPSR